MDRMTDAAIGELANLRHGAIAVADALSSDITRRQLDIRVARGQLSHPHPDVYVLVGAPPNWQQRLHVAAMAAGPGSAISHRAAAALWRFDGCPPGRVELTVPLQKTLRLPDVTVHRKRDLLDVDVEIRDRLPITTPTRTLIDLPAVVPFADDVEEALDSALRQGLTSMPRLWWRWGELRRSGRNGCALIGELLKKNIEQAVPQSVLERRFLRLVEPLGLGDWRLQHVIKRPDGSFVARVDFAEPRLKVIVEVDGHGSHSTRAQRAADAARRNELELLGWHVLVVTYEQVCFEEAYVRDLIRRSLRGYRRIPS